MRINNLGYLLKEGIKGIFLHGFMSFAAVCVTLACLLIMGLFASVMYNINILVRELNQTNEVLVYIDENMSEAEARSIETQIRPMDNVLSARFVNREQALKEFIADHEGDAAFNGVDAETLRHRVVVVLEDNALMEKTIEEFMKIDGVKFRQKVVPGDTLIFRVELLAPMRRGISSMKGYVFVGEKVVCEAEFTAQIVKNK